VGTKNDNYTNFNQGEESPIFRGVWGIGKESGFEIFRWHESDPGLWPLTEVDTLPEQHGKAGLQ